LIASVHARDFLTVLSFFSGVEQSAFLVDILPDLTRTHPVPCPYLPYTNSCTASILLRYRFDTTSIQIRYNFDYSSKEYRMSDEAMPGLYRPWYEEGTGKVWAWYGRVCC